MHKGEDTFNYLQLGYKVVSVEANPTLVKACEERFREAIARGQLIIVNNGIANADGYLDFWVNHQQSEWSSFKKEIGTRNGTLHHVEKIKCITMGRLFKTYGIPYYLKIDIEGHDHFCIEEIDPENKPAYVSCEAYSTTLLTTLHNKGYTKFKLINQLDGFKTYKMKRERSFLRLARNRIRWGLLKRVRQHFPDYTVGSSGFFGEQTDGRWYSYEEILDQYSSFYREGKPLNYYSWFDFHATYL